MRQKYMKLWYTTSTRQARFTASFERRFRPSLINTDPTKQPIAASPTTRIRAGMRTAHSRAGK